MTTVNWVEDKRATYVNTYGQTFKAGFYRRRNSTGGNRVPGEVDDLHPYTHEYVESFTQPITQQYRANCSAGFTDYLIGEHTHAVFGNSWTSNDELDLLGRLREQTDKHSFNTPVFVGELGKSVDMIASRARQIGKAAIAVKRGRLLDAARTLGLSSRASDKRIQSAERKLERLKARSGNRKWNGHPDNIRDSHYWQDLKSHERQSISDAWLELQYGIKPLANDIQNLASLVQALDTGRTVRVFARKRKPRVCTSGITTAANKNTCGTGSIPYYASRSESSYRKQIIAYYKEPVPTWGERLGLTDLHSVFWELTPWSFVADWVLPIGDWLDARAFARRAVGRFVHTYYVIEYVRGDGSIDACINMSDPVYGCVVNAYKPLPGSWYYKRHLVWRTIHDSLSVPYPSFEVPFKGPGPRLYNALALVASGFSRR